MDALSSGGGGGGGSPPPPTREERRDSFNSGAGRRPSGGASNTIILYDPSKEAAREDALRQQYNSADNFWQRGLVVGKAAINSWGKRYRYAKANYQANIYNRTGISPNVSGAALDTAAFYAGGNVLFGGVASGVRSLRGIGGNVGGNVSVPQKAKI
ncbi:hypothetical protein RH915_10415 [Serpentinicella sp. ANB-PHB4]|uniref:hypothetical protein n=1 Tax=Serpentinicella sp. ANB-PHB4 TaxID=3074076 RepID=UPI00285C74B4|nr:hypothetical protein [Serpentinicella sp. ANB-PHB4]MDR5659902.1 hypothetical protein [Serpentinicella sp. ANB-PHB4]